MIGRSVSHYKILERVGGGGMGVVYRAEDTKLRRTVALKFLPLELGSDEVAKMRFIREAQAASALDHPNICNIYEIDETPEGQLFIAMAYYAGQSLKELLAEGPLGVREAFEIATAVAQGLSRAHKNGIVHRDVKPANVMVTDDGYVKIVDFGLAKLEGVTQVTRSQFTVGTVAYMSPEQAAGEHVDERTDIWALGVVLYEMLAGKPPFAGGVDQAVIYSIMSVDPAPLRDVVPAVPERLSSIVAKCLAKNPKERYQTVDELLTDLGDVARALGWGSSVVARSVAPILRRKRRAWPRVVGAVAAVAAVIAALAWGWQRFGPEAEHSVFVTENRVAVLPLENMIGVSENAFANGLSEVISYLAEEAARAKKSAWVVPYEKVVGAPVASPPDAIGAFGVNQVIIGSLQRFADQRRVSLQLCNAADLGVIRSTNLNFDGLTCAGLPDSLSHRIAFLMGVASPAAGDMAPHLPTRAAAMEPYARGLALLQSDPLGAQLDSAITTLGAAVAADPDFPMAHATLGRAYTARYRLSTDATALDVARAHLQRALALSPDNVYSNIYTARLYFWLELYPEAIERYERVLALVPGHPFASLRLARLYNDDGRFDEAEELFLESVRRHPDYWATHFELGVLYYRRDRRDDALARWRKALEYAPNDVITLNNIGAVYHVTGEWQLARQYFQRAFQIRPTCETCSNMGLSHYFEGDYEEAARYYEFALEYCDTTEYDNWGNLAQSLNWVDGQRPKAVAAYRKAIHYAERELATRREDPKIIRSLIDYYATIDDRANGLRMIAYGDSVAGDDAEVMFRIGDAYEMFDERQLALRYIGSALRGGYPLEEIEKTPTLKALIEDPVFKQMKSEQEARESPAPAKATSE